MARSVRPSLLAHRLHGPARLPLLLLCLVLLLGHGCSYAKEEPGLFSQRASTSAPPTPAPVPDLPPLEPTNPQLPVAGRTVWTSADGLSVQVQLAVHAIRRISGATVLDWSVTPLRAPGLDRGEPIPGPVNLGLTRESPGDDVNILLLEHSRAKVYRPLTHRSNQEFHHCLCSPLWLAQLSLRVGETRMLQIAFPELPARVQFLDVDLITVAPFVHVPVTGLGQVPTARRATDLTRAPSFPRALSSPVQFSNPRDQPGRTQSITIEQVFASPGQTTLVWTLSSVTDQSGFGLAPSGPPLSAVLPPDILPVSQNSVSGPQIQAFGDRRPILGARWMTDKSHNLGLVECLCKELGLWASSLRDRGGRVSVATTYPPLPRSVRRIDVLLPGVGRVPHLTVTAAADSDLSVGPAVTVNRQQSWTYHPDNPPRGWLTRDWPTPLPHTDQLQDYAATVDDVVDIRG